MIDIMDMSKGNTYKIILADGTEIANLSVNGTNFVSDVPVDAGIFEMNCFPVTISDGENTEVHEHVELVQIAKYGKQYYIALRDIPESELEKEQIKSNIEYIAMMSDIEL